LSSVSSSFIMIWNIHIYVNTMTNPAVQIAFLQTTKIVLDFCLSVKLLKHPKHQHWLTTLNRV
jgi:hypothetical protein